MDNHQQIIDQIKFDEKGLVPAVIQDAENNAVLMVGYMNKDAVALTLKGPLVTFYSRSRGKLWVKGESSGHTQEIREIYFDCDADCLLIKVVQKIAACHTGYRSCFFRKVEGKKVNITASKIFEEGKIYKKT